MVGPVEGRYMIILELRMGEHNLTNPLYDDF